MRCAQTPLRDFSSLSIRALLIVSGIFVGPACFAQDQDTLEKSRQEAPWTQELKKYPGLPDELSHLFVRIQQAVQFPPPRSESRLLPLAPKFAVAYAAIPNYGEVASQVLKVLREELQESAVLRDWWTHGQLAADGTKIEDALDKFAQLHQYLGDELALSVTQEGKEPSFLFAYEVRRLGLKKFLQQMNEQVSGKSKPAMHILDAQELAAAKEKTPAEGLLVLVRPDFVAAATDLAALRAFNSRLAAKSGEFPATAFGRRVSSEYQGGVTSMAALDVHKILEKTSSSASPGRTFQDSGFADMQYLVWGHKVNHGKPVSEMELSFTSPRHGAAAWLAKPRPLGSLDFSSPDAIMAATIVLSDPTQILEDVKTFTSASNPSAFAALPVVEQGLRLSLKDDLLSLLSGEITVEVDSVAPPKPAWRAVVGVKDTAHLQRTFNTILTATHFEAIHEDVDGVAYDSVRIPSGKTTTEVVYTLADNYLILGSSRDTVAAALQLHHSGETLGKSRKFLAALPPDHRAEASALFYEDPIQMAALQLKSHMPDLAEFISKAPGAANPVVLSFYGEDSAIREVSANQSLDVPGVLIVAAIAIPNLLRSKVAANESSAVGSMRTINTAQVTYAAMYPQRAYAQNLASLGPDPKDPQAESPQHAGLLSGNLAGANCTGDAWCTKSGYQFRVTGICKLKACKEFVVAATPVSESTGTRSFCSTSDGIIHYKLGSPILSPVSVEECGSWPTL